MPPCPAADLMKGLVWILDNYARFQPTLINLSLHASGVSLAMEGALQELIDAGVPVVVAAGNNNAGTPQSSSWPTHREPGALGTGHITLLFVDSL